MSEVGLAVGLSIAAIITFACVLCVLFRVSLKYCILETVFRDYTSFPSQCMFGCMPDQPIDPKALAETRKHVEGFISGFIRHSFWLDNVQSRNEKIKGEDGYEVPVRIYNHRSCPSKVEAVLVYVHGGGWSVGSVDAYDRFVRALCTLCCADELELPSHIVANASTRIGTFRSIKGRVAIVSVDYRRAPDEAHFPVPLEDCYTAVKWVCAQSLERWGTSNVILCGDSAGGNLICGLSRLCRDRGAPQISGQIAVYPVVSYEASLNADDRYEPGFMIKPKSMNALWRDYLHSENNYRNPYANLLAADEHKGLPPTLLIVGTGDVLCREGVEYADALKNNGVRVRKSIYPNMHHSFFGMADIVKEAVQAMAEVKGFVSDIAMSKEDSGSAKSLSHSLHISLEDFSQRSILTGSETQPLLRIDEMT